VKPFVWEVMKSVDEGAQSRQGAVGEAFGGKREAQASGGGVFACAEQPQGEAEGFGVLGGRPRRLGSGCCSPKRWTRASMCFPGRV